MTEVHQAMNVEQNNMKSTVVVISPKMTSTDIDFITGLSDEFVRLQRLPSSPYELKNICKDDGALSSNIVMRSNKEVVCDWPIQRK